MPTDAEKSELLARWNATLPRQQELGENLITRYSEPHRRYHTTKHLLHVLTMIDRLADDHDLFLVRLAAWFHDAVYLPDRSGSPRGSTTPCTRSRPARSATRRPRPGWHCVS